MPMLPPKMGAKTGVAPDADLDDVSLAGNAVAAKLKAKVPTMGKTKGVATKKKAARKSDQPSFDPIATDYVRT